MPYDAIFFDAGNTLIFINPKVLLPLFEAEGARIDEATFWEAEFRARLNLSRTVEAGSSGTEGHVWKGYFESLFLGCGVPPDGVERVGLLARAAHDRGELWTYVDPATPPALEALKEDGFRLAVISNADGRVEGLLRKAGVHAHLEFVLDSHLEGVEKPDPEIFLRACRRMKVDPGRALYVGDLFPVDVIGARKAGLEAILLDPTGRLEYPVTRIPNVAALPGYLRSR